MMTNADTPVWDDMTFKELALHMSHERDITYATLCSLMETDKRWVDASVLHALGCVFRVDVALFQEGIDPVFVGHSLLQGTDVPSMQEPLDVVAMAMVNDFHFWGVRAAPSDDCGDLSLEHGGDVRLPQHSPASRKRAHSPGDGSDDEATQPASISLASKRVDSADVEAELNFCKVLMIWDPWEAPSNELEDAMIRVAGKAGAVRQLLRSQVIEDLATEAVDGAMLPDDVLYHRGAKYRINLNKPFLYNAASKKQLLKDDAHFRCQNLDFDCGRGAEKHHCLDDFRANPGAVHNWRVLFHSLPQPLRKEALMALCKESYDASQKAVAHAEWKVNYKLLGKELCKNAFLSVTGLGSSSITDARRAVNLGHQSRHTNAELGMGQLLMARSKPEVYMDARQWLTWYAATHADLSPISGEALLPSGRKEFYYGHYVHDRLRLNREHASMKCFYTVWRIEMPWLKVARSLCKFVKCGLCEYLKEQINLCQRSDVTLISMLRSRLGQHFEFQSAQRICLSNLEEKCLQSNGKKWLLQIDKMDMHAVKFPTVWARLCSPLFKEGEHR